ncbi:hypothetical protein ACWIUH_10600 [Ursidibacter arcticus]
MKYHLFRLSVISILSSLPVLSWAETEQSMVDKQHSNVKSTLHLWANSIDNWLGEPDPNKPASATLRIMLDNQWNRYDGYSIKPRVRAKVRLPALKKRLSVVIGDEDLDNQAQDKNQTSPTYREPLEKDKRYDRRQARNDNSSLALRWSDGIKNLGIDTDFDIGIRSGADIFARLKVSKEWQHNETYSTRLEQIYRYGLNSKHYLRTNFENKLVQDENTFINNHTYIDYRHDLVETSIWGNSLYREHNFSGYKRLNYGVSIGGDIDKKRLFLNYYGPFVTWRQPILRQWLFVQPEANFYNNQKLERKHTLGVFLRIEAVF